MVCAFGALIRDPLLTEYAILNVHPSLLPRWRGAAPIERAIIAGDEDRRLDHAPDRWPRLRPGGLAAPSRSRPRHLRVALARLEELGARSAAARAATAGPPFVEQPEAGVTYAEKIGPDDRTLDPAAAAENEREARRARAATRTSAPASRWSQGAFLGVHRAAVREPGAAGEPAR